MGKSSVSPISLANLALTSLLRCIKQALILSTGSISPCSWLKYFWLSLLKSMRFVKLLHLCLIGQFQVKCPYWPHWKHVPLLFPQGGPYVVATLPLAGPPPHLHQVGACKQSMSIGTGWLFIQHGVFVELYCSCCCCPPCWKFCWLFPQLFP